MLAASERWAIPASVPPRAPDRDGVHLVRSSLCAGREGAAACAALQATFALRTIAETRLPAAPTCSRWPHIDAEVPVRRLEVLGPKR